MPVLLDTRAMPAGDRLLAVADAMRTTTAPCAVRFDHEVDTVDVFNRMTAWQVGDTDLLRSEGSGMRMTRTRKHVAKDADGRVAVVIQERGNSTIDYFESEVPENRRPGELFCVDLTGPYEYGWRGDGSHFCLSVPGELLALPRDAIRTACRQIRSSPLYELFRRHLIGLSRDADVLSGDPAAASVAYASTELFRALMASASHNSRYALSAVTETMLSQIRTYIQQHIDDSGLNPDQIAAALNISVRQLFKVCAQADLSIEQWIINLRLERARAELVRPAAATPPIAAVARRVGFVDASHFSRRFKAAYGISPREWRLLHRCG